MGVSPVRERNEQRHLANTVLARRRDAAVDGAGRAAAQVALADANIGIVTMWVNRYTQVLPHRSVDELLDLGREQLVAAAGTWDPDEGASFASWSSFVIRARFQREVAKLYGAKLARVAIVVFNARTDLERELGRAATVAEVAGRVGLRPDRVDVIEQQVRSIRAAARASSLDANVAGTERSLYDTTSGASTPCHDISGSHDAAFATLPPRLRRLAAQFLHRGDTTVADVAARVAAQLDVPVSDVVDELAALRAVLAGSDD